MVEIIEITKDNLEKYSPRCFIANDNPGMQAKLEWVKKRFKELKTPKEAQNAPGIYSTFNLIYDGKLLADRYISITRFKNILKKEIK